MILEELFKDGEILKDKITEEFRELNARAASLTFSTLVAIVPLLAFCAASLQAFGRLHLLEPTLLKLLEPIGEKKYEVIQYTVQFSESLRLKPLIFLIALLVTYLLLTLKVEQAFNTIWQIREKRNRSRQIADFLSVIIIGPVLIFACLDLIADTIFDGLLSFVLLWGVFAIFYKLIPHTASESWKVEWKPALVGGIATCVLWLISAEIFKNVIAFTSRYEHYDKFAGPVLLLMWSHCMWGVILFGGQMAFYLQNKRAFKQKLKGKPIALSSYEREAFAVEIVRLIAKENDKLNFDGLKEKLDDITSPQLQKLLRVLEGKEVNEKGEIKKKESDKKFIHTGDTGFYNLSDDSIKVKDILKLVREPNKPNKHSLGVSQILHEANEAFYKMLSDVKVKDLTALKEDSDKSEIGETKSDLSNRESEEVAVEVMRLVAVENGKLNFEGLKEKLPLQVTWLQLHRILKNLKDRDLIASKESDKGFFLGRDTDQIKIKKILDAMRGHDKIESDEIVNEMMNEIDTAIVESLKGKTLRELIKDLPEDSSVERPQSNKIDDDVEKAPVEGVKGLLNALSKKFTDMFS